ncbi:MAG: DedA family protein [Chthonomonadales bacterium]
MGQPDAVAGTLPHVLRHAQELGPWVYPVLALLVMLEGPAATLLGASAAAIGFMRPIPVFITAASANMASDALWYHLGRLGKAEWMVDHARWLGLAPARVQLMQRKIRRNGVRMLFVAKLTLVFSVPALVAAGVCRVSYRRWLPYGIAAEALWTGTLVTLGYTLSAYIQRLTHGIQILAAASAAVFVPVMLVLVIRYASERSIQPEEDL